MYHTAGIPEDYEFQFSVKLCDVHFEQCSRAPSYSPSSIWFPPAAWYSTINQYPHRMSHMVRYKISVTLSYFITSLVFHSPVTLRVYRIRFILQCIHNCSRGNSYQIILGTNTWNSPGNKSLVLSSTTTIIHKKYNFPNNDIALIKLPTPINFTREYCHVLSNVKIVLLVLKHIKCYLFVTQNCVCLSHPCG